MDCFNSSDSGTFCASKVTEKTLYNIYRSAKDIEKLLLIDCGIRKLPENLFLHLPKLKVVDLRDNFLVSLPPSLAYHPAIEVMLLAGNQFLHPPPLLKTLPGLLTQDLGGEVLRVGGGNAALSLVSKLECQNMNFPPPQMLPSLLVKREHLLPNNIGVDCWGRQKTVRDLSRIRYIWQNSRSNGQRNGPWLCSMIALNSTYHIL